jgi:hypothetical protein
MATAYLRRSFLPQQSVHCRRKFGAVFVEEFAAFAFGKLEHPSR